MIGFVEWINISRKTAGYIRWAGTSSGSPIDMTKSNSGRASTMRTFSTTSRRRDRRIASVFRSTTYSESDPGPKKTRLISRPTSRFPVWSNQATRDGARSIASSTIDGGMRIRASSSSFAPFSRSSRLASG